MTASSNMESSSNILRRNSEDVGWDYGMLVDPLNLDKVKCKLCEKVLSGGIYRLKQHIAHVRGNTVPCKNSSDEDKRKCKKAIDDVKNRKRSKNQHEEEVRREVILEDDEEVEGSLGPPKKELSALGTMDKFVSSIDPDFSLNDTKKLRQQYIHESLWKERKHQVDQFLARWVYEAGIPFNAIDNDSFKRLMEAVGQFGPGYNPATQYQLREPLLKEEVERTKSLLKKQEEEWALNGCSIMTDAWTDGKRRSIMNLCVNCKEGTTFLSSKETSDEAHTGSYIFEYVDKCIEEVGPEKVVQVVTDNASNNMAAGNLLKLKRPNIFWTSCATHTLNLMLQASGNQPRFKTVIDKAKAFTIYIYAHHKTLSLMRRFTKKRDIVRPGVTRFATAFLTLQSLMEKKNELRAMVACSEWSKSKHSKSAKGKAAFSTALSGSFWNGASLCLKVFAPLVKVLRIVDGDKKPSMGFVYGELNTAKEEIKEAFKNQELLFRPIWDIIDEKRRGRLDGPLHLTAYLLNPYYTYHNPSAGSDNVVMNGFFTCVEAFFPNDYASQSEVTNIELLKFLKKEDGFGRPLATLGCKINDDTYDPVGWWQLYGNSVPKLQKMAKRILSLTTSSSGCERNWSTFEGIHTKRRNRLDTGRLNNLVYVQFNSRIINKKRRQKEKAVDVLLASEATMAQEWIVEDGDEDSNLGEELGIGGNARRNDRSSMLHHEVRELDEELDESDEEDGVEMDFEFESDTEGILERYGEEEDVDS